MIEWNNQTVIFQSEHSITTMKGDIPDFNMHCLELDLLPSMMVMKTQNYLYCITLTGWLSRIDRDWQVETLDLSCQDFFVCPKTEAITTLDDQLFLKRGDKRCQLPNNNTSEPSICVHIIIRSFSTQTVKHTHTDIQ